jgi:hypothetical protein
MKYLLLILIMLNGSACIACAYLALNDTSRYLIIINSVLMVINFMCIFYNLRSLKNLNYIKNEEEYLKRYIL